MGIVDSVPDPDPEDIKDVLMVISLYEEDTVCDNFLIDDETGLPPATVDHVLVHLWKTDRIECRVMGAMGRDPGLVGIRRVIDGRDRMWGEWGRYQDRG